MRIALGGIWHETNTFVPGRTGLADFAAYQLQQGAGLLEAHAGARTELGGALDAARRHGCEVVPLCYAAAVPSGLVDAGAFAELIERVIRPLRDADPVDGVLLALHGAMVVEDEDDPELALVLATREVVGETPIAIVLDLHANLSVGLADAADVILGYQTFPHVDMAERGAEALDLLVRIVSRGRRRGHALLRLPLLTVPQMQGTAERPVAGLEKLRAHLAADGAIDTISLFPGYPYADHDRLGFAIYAAGDRDAAEAACQLLGDAAWAMRREFLPRLLEPRDAVAAAVERQGPVVLVDVADNVGGGSPGDGTVLLTAMLERGVRGATVLWDPRAVDEIYHRDEDLLTLDVGGRATTQLGEPVTIEGRVTRFGNVRYRRTGAYMRGQTVNMGRVARVACRAGDVVLTERRVMPFDDDHLRAVGIAPEQQAVIVAKSAFAWRAAFGSYAMEAHFVRTPGFCPSDLEQLPYAHRATPAFPLEEEALWP